MSNASVHPMGLLHEGPDDCTCIGVLFFFYFFFLSVLFHRDLRFNKIKDLQPGSFRRLRSLNTLWVSVARVRLHYYYQPWNSRPRLWPEIVNSTPTTSGWDKAASRDQPLKVNQGRFLRTALCRLIVTPLQSSVCVTHRHTHTCSFLLWFHTCRSARNLWGIYFSTSTHRAIYHMSNLLDGPLLS